VTRAGHPGAGEGIDQGFGALGLGVAFLAFSEPGGGDGIVVVRPGGASVIAEVALVGSVVDAPLPRALGYIVFDRQVVDPDLIADAVLGGVVDDHVLDDLDATGVGLVDEVLIGGIGGLQPRVDTGPVVGVVAVVVQFGAVFYRRRDPDGGEAEIPQVIQALDQAAEVTSPVGVLRFAGRVVEADAVSAEKWVVMRK